MVASPSAIGSMPEASGSSVPAWPALSASNSRFTLRDGLGRAHADRLVEHHPAVDLPALLLAATGHQSWSLPSSAEIARHLGRPQQLVDPGEIVVAGVELEAELRHGPHLPERRRHASADEAGVAVERVDDRRAVLGAERRDKGGGELQIGRHAHLGDRDHEYVSMTSSRTSPRCSISDSAWRTCSPTRSWRCEGPTACRTVH